MLIPTLPYLSSFSLQQKDVFVYRRMSLDFFTPLLMVVEEASASFGNKNIISCNRKLLSTLIFISFLFTISPPLAYFLLYFAGRRFNLFSSSDQTFKSLYFQDSELTTLPKHWLARQHRDLISSSRPPSVWSLSVRETVSFRSITPA